MATDISICSNALQMLGDKAIAAFTDDSVRASLAGNLYPSLRDALLRSHPWNCLVTRAALSPEVGAPAFGYAYKFLIPADFVRMVACGQDGAEHDYRIERGMILADENPLYIRYISNEVTEASWDPSMVHCMQLTMMSALAYPITASTSLAESLKVEAANALRSAKALDGQDNPAETLGDFPLLRARG